MSHVYLRLRLICLWRRFVDAERYEERAGDRSDVRDVVRRHGSALEVARGANRERVQATDVGTYEGTRRRAVRRKLATKTVTGLQRGKSRTGLTTGNGKRCIGQTYSSANYVCTLHLLSRVRTSVCYPPVLYQNGLLYRHTFFSTSPLFYFSSNKHLCKIPYWGDKYKWGV